MTMTPWIFMDGPITLWMISFHYLCIVHGIWNGYDLH